MDAHAGRISQYRVLDELGRDRLGYVLRAQDEQLDRPVVLRIVRAASVYPADRVESIRTSFQSEAQRAARVSHPNLATIYSFQRIDDVDLVAMEQVEGTSLRALLALGERWRVPEVARLMARVADAVAAAHTAGMTHGRLSLANVVVRPDGRVKVLDLGIPHAPTEELDGEATAPPPRPATRAEDVYALALMTLELAATASLPPGALWRPIDTDPEAVAAMLADEAAGRRRYGILAPIVRRAVAPADGDAYAAAGDYRDALLATLAEPSHAADGRETDGSEADVDLGPGTPLVVPHGPPIPDAADDALDEVGAGAGAESEADRAPRLVLTADLAKGPRQAPPADAFVVMAPGPGLGARLRGARGPIGGASRLVVPKARVNRSAMVRVAVIVILLAAAGLTAWRVMATDGAVDAFLARAEPIAASVRDRVRDVVSTRDGADGADPEPTEVRPPHADSADSDDSDDLGMGEGTSAVAARAPAETDVSLPVAPTSRTPAAGGEAPSPADPALRSAIVRATSPPGTAIRVDGRPGMWHDAIELAVADGDSLIIRFERQGYVPEARVFKGNRLAVALRPDSVVVQFSANLPADVYLEHADGARSRIGTTEFARRLPTGTHRIVFVAAGQPEYATEEHLIRAGQSYRVEKLDYVTQGSLVAQASPTWAWVSVDGGPPQETPARMDDLEVGTHTIAVTREGFVPIADTVVIRPGRVVTKQYTLTARR